MRIKAFTKTYGEKIVASFDGMELEKGKIFAIIGANGSGKSTIARIIAGALKPDSKSAVTENKPVVNYMPQRSFSFRMSVMKNILITCGNSEEDKKKAEYYMDRLELTELKDQRADKLSGGETGKMALSRVMMRDCDILVLDEPTAAMDVKSTIAAEKLIQEYRDRTGASVIMITHSLTQAQRVADYTLFISDGRVCEFGETAKLINSPEKDETRQFIEFYGV